MPLEPEDQPMAAAKPKAWRLLSLLDPRKPLLPKASRQDRSSDWVVAALGVTLGLICTLFPWYIFLNPDQFGPPEVRFEGVVDPTASVVLSPQAIRVGAPMNVDDIPIMELDLFATGTSQKPKDEHENGQEAEGAVEEQPFPPVPVTYKLIHVENGRAMIEDDAGLFVVQRGSTLPDNSQVVRIEQREGRWVLVTSDDDVIEMSE